MARTPPVTVARESERHDRTVPPRFARRHGVTASAGRDAEAAVRATNVRTRIGIAEKLKATVKMALSKNCTPCVAEQRARGVRDDAKRVEAGPTLYLIDGESGWGD